MKRPAAAEHQAGDRRAAENMVRNDFTGTVAMVRRAAKRNGTGTHSPRVHNDSTLFLSMPPHGQLRQSISQRRGASLRRLLVKCGLSEGGCWAIEISYANARGIPAHLRSQRQNLSSIIQFRIP